MIAAITTAIGAQPAIRSGTKEPVMTNRTATTAAIILSLAAAGAPAASARPLEYAPPGKQAPANVYAPPASVYSRPDKAMIPITTPQSSDIATPAAPQAVVRVQAPNSGFDWGDAGIGAAGGVALAMLGVGGALVISHQRPRRIRETTSLPN
jgi:hypothetical protein